jgi:hypothetical protein
MGRPLKRDVNGVLVFGDYTDAEVGIRGEAYFGGSLRTDVFLVKQKGTRRYLCQDKSDSTTAVCKLVSDRPAANGEAKLTGRVVAGGAIVQIAKLQKRTAIDWSGNRYKWSLADDSSSDDILLVAV